VVVLALSTGARKMELLRLPWRDVDLQRGVITLHDTKKASGVCYHWLARRWH
jgi:integrase